MSTGTRVTPSVSETTSKVPRGTLYRGNEGMWSWVLHRITGVAIFFFLLVHVLDTALIRAVRREVTVPVIASGGAGAVEHFGPAVAAGADAVLAASVFHFGIMRIGEVKDSLRDEGVEVR